MYKQISEQECRNKVVDLIEDRFNLKLEDEDQFTGMFHKRHLAAGEDWVSAGDLCDEYCVIMSGIMRVFYRDVNGNEVNDEFYSEGNFVAPIDSLLSGTACVYYIQAIEPVIMLAGSYKQFVELRDARKSWFNLELKLTQKVYTSTAQSRAQLLLGDAQHRYLWLKKEKPELLSRLSQGHIASYLGMSAVTLSRLKNKLAKTMELSPEVV